MSVRTNIGALRTRLSRWLREEHGSSTIETALGLSMMFALILGVVEFSMMVYTYGVYADAARYGVRYAVTHGSDAATCSGPGCTDSTGTNVASAVTNHVNGLTTLANNVNVAVSYPDSSAAPPSRVSVTVTYTYKPMFGLKGMNQSFSASSAGRIEY